MLNFLIIFAAKYLYLLVILGAIAFFLFQKRPVQKNMVFVSILGLPIAYALAWVAGKIYYEPRPFVVSHFKPLVAHAPTNGFPSDHALLCFAIAAVVFNYNKKIGSVLGVLGFLVGLGRVLAGIHTMLDVGASFVIAVGVIFLLKRFVRTEVSPIYE